VNKFLFIALFFLAIQSSYAQTDVNSTQQSPDTAIAPEYIYNINDSLTFIYKPTKKFGFVKNAFTDFYMTPTELVKKGNLKGLALVAVSSAILIYYDQELIDAAQQFGRYIGLSTDNKTYNLTGSKKLPINVPTDLSSGLYYIGDGITEIAVNAGFYIYGLATDDKRALQTAAQLAEGMITVGSWIQILKHASGHETPERASVSGGRWRFLPSPADYQKSVPKYDAFPSGHLATAMMTTTVISMNYPEYKFIRPLCFTLMGICGYQMMNNGVHWAGDYPLAIAMGYSIGKMAVNRGHTVVKHDKNTMAGWSPNKRNYKFGFRPAYLGFGTSGLALSLDF
jgi:hypothetical protein